jgi:hypothetical protein
VLPLTERLWTGRHYITRFEPEFAGLSVTASKGWCEAGAAELPFNLQFEPVNSDEIETTLIVSFGEFETRTLVTASVVGGTKKAAGKRHRRHE